MNVVVKACKLYTGSNPVLTTKGLKRFHVCVLGGRCCGRPPLFKTLFMRFKARLGIRGRATYIYFK